MSPGVRISYSTSVTPHRRPRSRHNASVSMTSTARDSAGWPCLMIHVEACPGPGSRHAPSAPRTTPILGTMPAREMEVNCPRNRPAPASTSRRAISALSSTAPASAAACGASPDAVTVRAPAVSTPQRCMRAYVSSGSRPRSIARRVRSSPSGRRPSMKTVARASRPFASPRTGSPCDTTRLPSPHRLAAASVHSQCRRPGSRAVPARVTLATWTPYRWTSRDGVTVTIRGP